MTLTVPSWAVIGVLWLALFGAWFTASRGWRLAWDGIWRFVYWLRWGRVAPLLEDEFGCACCEAGCCYGVDPEECGQCGHPETWHAADLDLPPEQSAEALGFTAASANLPWAREWHGEAFERRAPWWEAEHRAAYDALGFDYPSGLMARVRELTS